jgi:hypothetical protein
VVLCRAVRPRPARSRRPRSARAARLDVPERPAVNFIPDHDYRCAIDELRDCSCRYPLWDTATRHPDRRYCGFPSASLTAGVPYCRHHTALCETLRRDEC